MKPIMKIIPIVLVVLLNTSCEKDYSSLYPYDPPSDLNDGLVVGTLEDVGMDKTPLQNVVGRIHDGKYGEVHSMLVYKDGFLVMEEYFSGHQYQWDGEGHKGGYTAFDRETQHCIHSDTKSFVSLCIGIAIEQGYIESVDQSIFDYLPDHQHLKTEDNAQITIEHLLTMTSGWKWDEWGVSLGSIENDQIGVWFWEDGPMDFILRREVVATPGTRFNYSGGDIQVLAEILHNATGLDLDGFSEQFIFEPMGISSFDWWLVFETGEIQAAGGLKLTPRDMVKVGAMMLNMGMWYGTQVIPEDWVSECTEAFGGNTGIRVPGEDLGKVGYAYTWWTKDFNYNRTPVSMHFALGWGGQKIIFLPDFDMVIAFTGANYTSTVHQFAIIEDYILPSVN